MPGHNSLVEPDIYTARPVSTTGLPMSDVNDVNELPFAGGAGSAQFPLAAILLAATAYLFVMRKNGFKGIIISN